VELLHSLEVCELVGGQEAVPDLRVWQVLRKVCDEVQGHPEGLLGKSVDIDNHVKHLLLIVDVLQSKASLHDSKPSFYVVWPEGRKDERAMVLLVVVHS
jgi:hypothetical protein